MGDMDNDKKYDVINAHTGAVVFSGLPSVEAAARRIQLAKFHDARLGGNLAIRRADDEEDE